MYPSSSTFPPILFIFVLVFKIGERVYLLLFAPPVLLLLLQYCRTPITDRELYINQGRTGFIDEIVALVGFLVEE